MDQSKPDACKSPNPSDIASWYALRRFTLFSIVPSQRISRAERYHRLRDLALAAAKLLNLLALVDQRPFVRLARGLGELWLAELLVFVAGSHGLCDCE
jgi:hypothetical protein